MKTNAAARNVQSDTDREALFKQFQAWEAEKPPTAPAPRQVRAQPQQPR
jgi:hypothetical protein